MSTVVSILLILLLTLSVVLVAIQVNNTLNKQANLIIELQQQREKFTTPNNAWNSAASYMNRRNYLLTTSQNERIKRDKPFYLNGPNQSRSVLPLNYAVPTKQAIELPDDNDMSGYRNTVHFPGALNPTALVRNNNSSSEVKKSNVISVPGADIKNTNLVYDDNAAPVMQKPNVDLDEADANFSVNNRANASASRALMSNESTADKALESYGNRKWRRLGKV